MKLPAGGVALAHLEADRIPPTTEFELGWASPALREEISAYLVELRRQTMNVRVMTAARLMYLRALNDGAIVGWGGVDADHDPERPELFSLYVDPDYRTFLLGLVLELGRCVYLRSRGQTAAFLRISKDGSEKRLEYRISKKLYVPIDRAELPDSYLGLCQRCELFGKDCRTQAFFRVDIGRFIEHAESRLGPMDLSQLPRRFTLDPQMIRQRREEVSSGVARRSFVLRWSDRDQPPDSSRRTASTRGQSTKTR